MNKWDPYLVGETQKVRPLQSKEGLGDRLRLIAFAERQAYYAFTEACVRFKDEAPSGLLEAWSWVAQEEKKHEGWYLNRLLEIGEDVAAVPVDLKLYHSFSECNTAREFSLYISDAEERGRIGALRFSEVLMKTDPVSAAIFAQVAFEESEHVALTSKFFPKLF